MGDILDATDRTIKAAKHLTDMDAGAVETIRALALKIDLQDEYFQELADQASERKLRPPSPDNVSIPTYLKYCEALGLTPSGRTKLEPAKEPEDKSGNKLAGLRSVHAGETA